MLGSMLVKVLGDAFHIVGTSRGAKPEAISTGADWRFLDAESCSLADLVDILHGSSWAINAVGVIKSRIREDNPSSVETAIRVNSLFPYALAVAARKTHTRIIQIATDCVYSGKRGHYLETDDHDAIGVYGTTKSLGEVSTENVCNLRCSIVGPELRTRESLLSWFLSQRHSAEINGFTNHRWNGITTLHFAKLCRAIIEKNLELPNLQHIVPTGTVTKYELLRIFAGYFARRDLRIVAKEGPDAVDRSLDTLNPNKNLTLWQSAGYARPPEIPQMISEVAALATYSAPTS